MSMPNPEPSPAAAPPAAVPGPPSSYISPSSPAFASGPYGPPHGTPGYAFSPQPAPPARAEGRGLGVTAVILGAIPLLLGLVQPFTARLLLGSSNGYTLYSTITALSAILNLALGVGALVCGLVARRRWPLWGGIGIGLGAASTIGASSSLLYAIPGLAY